MTDLNLNFWTKRDYSAHFSEPDACAARSTVFEKAVRRRNLIEYVAGGLVVLLFGAMTVGAAVEGLLDFALAGLAILVGALFVVWKLNAAGSNLDRRPEQTCRAHHRAQLVRQRNLLRDVPRWYLAPFLPGMALLYGTTIVRVGQRVGYAEAIEPLLVPLGATIAFFGFVAWLNLRAAGQLDREIEALDASD